MDQSASDAMVVADGLGKRFPVPGGADVDAVADLDFVVRAGEVYGLLGPNGAGKTTTVRMLLGMLTPTSGRALIDGVDAAAQPAEVKRRVGLVSASAGVYPYLTVREMLLYFADLYAVAEDVAAPRVEALAVHFDIGDLLERTCSTLSTGQRQRVNLCRALVHDPPVLLLDEPTLGLDVIGTQLVVEYIGHLRSQGRAVILCTHRLSEAEILCTRCGLLHEGRLKAEGTLPELRAQTGCASLSEMFLNFLGRRSFLFGDAAATQPAGPPDHETNS